MLKIVVSSGIVMMFVYMCGVIMFLIGLIVIILSVVSCLLVFIRLILVVSDVFVWFVNSSVVMIGLSLCMSDSVISRLSVCLEL